MSVQIKVRESLLSDLNVVYQIRIPPAELLDMEDYKRSAYCTLIAKFGNMPITHIIPKYFMGRVMSFNVYPKLAEDPILIWSESGDLIPYYKIWKQVTYKGMPYLNYSKKCLIEEYDEAIKTFLRTSDLNYQEMCFAVIEMLKFENTNMLY